MSVASADLPYVFPHFPPRGAQASRPGLPATWRTMIMPGATGGWERARIAVHPPTRWGAAVSIHPQTSQRNACQDDAYGFACGIVVAFILLPVELTLRRHRARIAVHPPGERIETDTSQYHMRLLPGGLRHMSLNVRWNIHPCGNWRLLSSCRESHTPVELSLLFTHTDPLTRSA